MPAVSRSLFDLWTDAEREAIGTAIATELEAAYDAVRDGEHDADDLAHLEALISGQRKMLTAYAEWRANPERMEVP